MGIWQDSAAEVADAVDEVFGEMVSLRPQMTRPNYPPTDDPQRPAMQLLATFIAQSIIAGQQAKPGVKMEPLVRTQNPVFTFNRFSLPYSLQRGDVIERCTGELFEATDIKPDGWARVAVDAVQLGRSSQ